MLSTGNIAQPSFSQGLPSPFFGQEAHFAQSPFASQNPFAQFSQYPQTPYGPAAMPIIAQQIGTALAQLAQQAALQSSVTQQICAALYQLGHHVAQLGQQVAEQSSQSRFSSVAGAGSAGAGFAGAQPFGGQPFNSAPGALGFAGAGTLGQNPFAQNPYLGATQGYGGLNPQAQAWGMNRPTVQ